MDLDHFGVILRSESSLAGNIDDHCQPIFPQKVKVELCTSYIVNFEIKEAGWDLPIQPFSSRFKDQLLKQSSHNQLKLIQQ